MDKGEYAHRVHFLHSVMTWGAQPPLIQPYHRDGHRSDATWSRCLVAAHLSRPGADPPSPRAGPGMRHSWDFACPGAVRRYTTTLCMPGPLNVKSIQL